MKEYGIREESSIDDEHHFNPPSTKKKHVDEWRKGKSDASHKPMSETTFPEAYAEWKCLEPDDVAVWNHPPLDISPGDRQRVSTVLCSSVRAIERRGKTAR